MKEYDNNNYIKNTEKPLFFEEQKTNKKCLFPYKYYLCSIFIKSKFTSSKPFFFTKKFISVYNYICQLLDISSYLLMQKEFELMKSNYYFDKSEKNKISRKNYSLFDINNKKFE